LYNYICLVAEGSRQRMAPEISPPHFYLKLFLVMTSTTWMSTWMLECRVFGGQLFAVILWHFCPLDMILWL